MEETTWLPTESEALIRWSKVTTQLLASVMVAVYSPGGKPVMLNPVWAVGVFQETVFAPVPPVTAMEAAPSTEVQDTVEVVTVVATI